MQVLSTKKLTPNQRNLFLGSGFTVVDYNAINIELLDFEIPKIIANAIFTSQNGVRGILNRSKLVPSQFEKDGVMVFCVGQKTKALLEQNGLKVNEMAKNSAELGVILAKKYKNQSFHYFCGSERRDELPDALKKADIQYLEVKTYETTLKLNKFEQKWNGVLFFSPSGVASYFIGNKENVPSIPQQGQNSSPLLICIGETTATEARKHSTNVVVAKTTSVESVITEVVKTLKKDSY